MLPFIVLSKQTSADDGRYVISVHSDDVARWLRTQIDNDQSVIECGGGTSVLFNVAQSTLMHLKLVWS